MEKRNTTVPTTSELRQTPQGEKKHIYCDIKYNRTLRWLVIFRLTITPGKKEPKWKCCSATKLEAV